MSLRFAILGLLAHYGPQSGYDLKQRFEYGPNHIWSSDLAHIYRTLDKLRQGHFVSVATDADSSRGRKVYSITNAGRDELQEWLMEDFALSPVRDPVLLRLFFGSLIPKERLREQLEFYLEQQRAQLDVYAHTTQFVSQLEQQWSQDILFWQMLLELGKRHTETTIDWCQEFLKRIE